MRLRPKYIRNGILFALIASILFWAIVVGTVMGTSKAQAIIPDSIKMQNSTHLRDAGRIEMEPIEICDFQ